MGHRHHGHQNSICDDDPGECLVVCPTSERDEQGDTGEHDLMNRCSCCRQYVDGNRGHGRVWIGVPIEFRTLGRHQFKHRERQWNQL